MPFQRFAIAATALALVGVCASAQAVIVNIDATTATPTTQTFAAGTYDIAVIGKAQGGLYDGWTYNFGSGLYREAFTGSYPGVNLTVDHYSGSTTGYYQNFASASAALAAFSGGEYAIIANGSYSFTTSLLEWTFGEATTVSFSVPDYQFNDNTGGVSLSITSAASALETSLAVTSAVPEPESYALMLAGLGALGFVARRRRTA